MFPVNWESSCMDNKHCCRRVSVDTSSREDQLLVRMKQALIRKVSGFKLRSLYGLSVAIAFKAVHGSISCQIKLLYTCFVSFTTISLATPYCIERLQFFATFLDPGLHTLHHSITTLSTAAFAPYNKSFRPPSLPQSGFRTGLAWLCHLAVCSK